MTTPASPVIVALDFPDAGAALALARRLDPGSCRVKVGKELFVAAGPGLVEELQGIGFELFLDLKFHDIPHTVAAAVRRAAKLGVWMVNVHASGGRRMLEASADALADCREAPQLIGVTVLTSMEASDLAELGVQRSVEEQVLFLADLCAECGLDGVVCSAREATALRTRVPSSFHLVTPGIRPVGSARDDQRRVVTPDAALRDGSDYLVIGRPITAAEDPASALAAINRTIGY